MGINVIVGNSRIHGKGVFAARDFRRGETVLRWDTSQIISEDRLNALMPEQRRFLSYIGGGRYVLLQEPEKYVNHSCDSNTIANNCSDIAVKDIRAGEEITADYSLEGLKDLEMRCNCGIINCRSIIYGDFERLDPDTKEKLMPFLQDWYKQEIFS